MAKKKNLYVVYYRVYSSKNRRRIEYSLYCYSYTSSNALDMAKNYCTEYIYSPHPIEYSEPILLTNFIR